MAQRKGPGGEATGKGKGKRAKAAEEAAQVPLQETDQGWLGFPEVSAETETPASVQEPTTPAAQATAALTRDGFGAHNDLELRLEVPRRRPRLAWHGRDRRELAAAVPTQVVEIVRPGRAMAAKEALAGLADVRPASARSASTVPPNRLIWTNDNIVALQTLLDEKDPDTHDYRYRGKVDLVYIDPPFMVNNDFQADNAIDIELDDEEGIQARKEPSLVEILAYKDTWREGLDSFLTMLRARLVLLKDLLAPTGSIYVHLDWHASHYVKVMMDEVFGYENFMTEVVWKRASARAGSNSINHVHDVMLSYCGSYAAYHNAVRVPQDAEYVRSHYRNSDERGRYRLIPLNAPGESKGETGQPWRGYAPPRGRHWSHGHDQLDVFVAQGLVQFPTTGRNPELKQYLAEQQGVEIQSIWTDLPPVNAQAMERLGYPTQKPVALLERIISASCPPGGLVLDCFMGSGTTAEAAERLGRRFIGIDNSKYAIHLGRKRLIQLHGQPRPPEKPAHDYVECAHCKNIERKEKPQRSPGPYQVKAFTLENMGVYQRAEQWQDFQRQRSKYRDEMIRVFGGEPVAQSALLHGRKGDSWVHVGPLDGPVAVSQVWSIAREAQRTSLHAVQVLSADFDTLSASEKDDIERATKVAVTIRAIPASAIDEVRRRLEIRAKIGDGPIESMAIPAFYAPLSLVLSAEIDGRRVRLTLARCEVDIESFLASQKPLIKPVTDGMAPTARKKAESALEKWAAREKELKSWLQKANSWRKFVDFWAVDWDYGRRVGPDGRPIFETDWQSFRLRRSKSDVEPLVLTAEFKYDEPGQYRVAARVTDVFGNDGIAAVSVEVQ